MAKTKGDNMQKISTCLWFDNQAEEAVNFYASVFKNLQIGNAMRYDAASAKASGQPEGSVMTIEFQLEGQDFMALNGGPIFKFTEAISFVVGCDDQEEIDYYWEKLSAVPASEQCGWLKDKYGLSWQIVPRNMDELIKSPAAMAAMMKMKKIDIDGLKRASSS
jgi:predicted 3-demethylubiquinone-9 3-methyltransferase (glyoxalase superfamily)